MHCSTCGKDSETSECAVCAQWWKDNPPNSDDDNAMMFGDDEEMDDDWSEMMCSMGPDGQCGQAGSEWCDFECPTMRALRAGKPRG